MRTRRVAGIILTGLAGLASGVATATSTSRHPQTLCRRAGAGRTTCRAGRGIWHLSLPRRAGTWTFVLKTGSRVVGSRTVRLAVRV